MSKGRRNKACGVLGKAGLDTYQSFSTLPDPCLPLGMMPYIKTFSARYSDEGAIYDQLGKLFPMAAGVSVIVTTFLPI